MRARELLALNNDIVDILKVTIETELKRDEEVTNISVVHNMDNFEFYIDYANEGGRFSEGFQYNKEGILKCIRYAKVVRNHSVHIDGFWSIKGLSRKGFYGLIENIVRTVDII